MATQQLPLDRLIDGCALEPECIVDLAGTLASRQRVDVELSAGIVYLSNPDQLRAFRSGYQLAAINSNWTIKAFRKAQLDALDRNP